MKILLISPLILPVPDVQGGAIERLMTMLLEQNEIYNKHEFYIISVKNAQAEEIAKKYKNSKVFFINYRFRRLYVYIRAILHKVFKIVIPVYNLNYIKIMWIINKIEPDVVVEEGGGGENLFFLSRKYGKNKFYLHLHSQYNPNAVLDETFGTVISVSDFINNEWLKKTSNKRLNTAVVKNCIDNVRFSKKLTDAEYKRLRKKLGYVESDFIVIYCGRIVKEKGVKELLQAFEKINNKNIKLLMIGSPNFAVKCQTKYLKEVTKRVNKLKNVQWIGYVDNGNLYQYYQISDLMVIPSICKEACPLTPIEGMTSGLPILATRSGGLPELVSTECSILVDIDEGLTDNLYKNINHLYSYPEERKKMAAAALQRSKEFSIEKYYHDFSEVFDK